MTKSRCDLATQWQHDSPEHDDMVVKADGLAERQWQYSWRQARCEVLPAGATRKLLREPNR
jgi:hypothetical protein